MDIVGKLHNASILDRLGFQTDHFMTADEAAGGGWLELAQRNLMAHEFGTFVVALLRNRLRRNLFLLGSWPVRACLFAPVAFLSGSRPSTSSRTSTNDT